MDTSDHYIVAEKMIRQGDVPNSELQHLLESLEQQGRISPAERHALLQLAEQLKRNKPTSP
jgi:hypothetical protein